MILALCIALGLYLFCVTFAFLLVLGTDDDPEPWKDFILWALTFGYWKRG